MKKIVTVLLLPLLLVSVVSLAASCKKEQTASGSSAFDPQVDALAVRPLPPLDFESAQYFLRRHSAAAAAAEVPPAEAPASPGLPAPVESAAGGAKPPPVVPTTAAPPSTVGPGATNAPQENPPPAVEPNTPR